MGSRAGTPLPPFAPLALLLAGPASAQRVAYHSAAHRWTLRSGPVLYRLATRDGRVVLDYFGPAGRESDTTRVMPTYTRISQVDLAGRAD